MSRMSAQMNGLQMIVRAHECVMDGFERFAQGHLITLFSATNYCGTANNAGAHLSCPLPLTTSHAWYGCSSQV
jgi:hypothetical protein